MHHANQGTMSTNGPLFAHAISAEKCLGQLVPQTNRIMRVSRFGAICHVPVQKTISFAEWAGIRETFSSLNSQSRVSSLANHPSPYAGGQHQSNSAYHSQSNIWISKVLDYSSGPALQAYSKSNAAQTLNITKNSVPNSALILPSKKQEITAADLKTTVAEQKYCGEDFEFKVYRQQEKRTLAQISLGNELARWNSTTQVADKVLGLDIKVENPNEQKKRPTKRQKLMATVEQNLCSTKRNLQVFEHGAPRLEMVEKKRMSMRIEPVYMRQWLEQELSEEILQGEAFLSDDVIAGLEKYCDAEWEIEERDRQFDFTEDTVSFFRAEYLWENSVWYWMPWSGFEMMVMILMEK